jgi:membrane protein
MDLKTLFALVKQAVKAWIDDQAQSMGAAIAYYTVFSIAPLLIIVIAAGGMVVQREAVQGQIVEQLGGLIGPSGAVAIQSLIQSASIPARGVLATAVSVVVLAIGATTVFAEVQNALDRIWREPAAPKQRGIVHLLRTRLLSFGLVLCLGFIMLVSLVITAGLAALAQWTSAFAPGWESILQAANFVFALGCITVLFAVIFKVMPRATVGWEDVWVGAGVTAVLFEFGKLLIGLYIGKSSIASGFAATGALVVLLIWVYYSAQIFLLGAEFTWVFAHWHGSRSRHPASAAGPAGIAGVMHPLAAGDPPGSASRSAPADRHG